MQRRHRNAFAALAGLLATSFLVTGCRDALVPELTSVPSAFPHAGAEHVTATGEGGINDTLALAGRNRQEFDFDVTDTPSGRLFVRDFSVVRSDGSVGTFTADPMTDPATSVSSFVQTSATCVAFGGIGRVDTGDLLEFSVEACDHGNPGAEVDSFRLAIPGISYTKSNTLTDGEITVHGVAKGDIEVTAVTTGADLDADGYTVTLDSTMSQAVDVNATVRFNVLAEGTYTVALGGVAANCTVTGGNPRTVTVVAGTVTGTTFEIACTATTASMRVRGLGAIGSPLALPHQNRLEFDFEATGALTGSVVVRDYSIVRSDGSVGHIIADPATDPETAITSFSRTSSACVKFGGIGRHDSGTLYQFFIDACDQASEGAGADTFNISLPDRPYNKGGTLTEGDIVVSSSSADSAPPPAGARITGLGTMGTGSPTSGGDLQEFDFDVAPDLSGRLFYRDWRFDATVTVDEDPLTLITAFRDESAMCADPARGVEFDGTGRRETGDYEVFTVRACDNGPASGEDFLRFSTAVGYVLGDFLSSGDIVKSTAEPSPTTGDLTVTAATTGADSDPDGYLVMVDGTTSHPVATNGSVTFSGLSEGDHLVALSDVAANCAVGGENPRSVTVIAGGVIGTTFDVSCTATTSATDTRVTGLGTMGAGSPTAGSDLQDFDFDLTSNLTGRLFYRDWNIAESDGTVATLTVDADPLTAITAFRDESPVCEDRTRGAEVEGTGRLDTGELVIFKLRVCDNGAAESGEDFLWMSTVQGYSNNGRFLSSGDIVKLTAASAAASP